jgi:PhzF family phenazine biosynthesis protein
MKIRTVDAFTNKPFSGNPAGVLISEQPLEESLMQKIANEMNHAETAFLYPIDGGYKLRWFTPTVEAQLCGHATLATAHILFEEEFVSQNTVIKFQTASGELTATKRGDFIELDFPAIKTEKKEVDPLIPEAIGEKILNASYDVKGYWIVEVENEEIVRRINPDFKLLAKIEALVIVTGKSSTSKYDFVSRVFVPAWGIDEDPVTGAAHCALTVYWAQKLDKKELSAYQASKRGGELKLRLEGDRVKLIGQAVATLKGKLLL